MLSVGCRIRFHEYTGITYEGEVTAIWPDAEVYVKYDDGVIGIFEQKYSKYLEVML